MSRIKTNNMYTLEQRHSIYVILHPATKEFFVHFTAAKDLRSVYKEHYKLRNPYTKKLFEEHKDLSSLPEMFILETVITTAANCYSRQLIWIKYFMEHGYYCLNQNDDIDSSEDLFEENELEYQKIQSCEINNILTEKILYENPKSRKKIMNNPSDKVLVNFLATYEERELIKKNATKNNKTKTAYLIELGLTGHVFQVDYPAIQEHTKELSIIKDEINAIIKFAISQNAITSSEITKIIELLTQINKSENKLLSTVRKEQSRRMTKIKTMLKKLHNPN